MTRRDATRRVYVSVCVVDREGKRERETVAREKKVRKRENSKMVHHHSPMK